MAATLSHYTSSESGASTPNYGTRYASSRRSSSSSSSSQSKAMVARPYSHMPTTTTSAAQSGYFAHEPTVDQVELLISQQNLHAKAEGLGSEPGSAFTESRPPVANVWKGKERAATYHERPSTMYQMGEDTPKGFRASWMINEEVASVGAESWVERDRVILILGRKSEYQFLSRGSES